MNKTPNAQLHFQNGSNLFVHPKIKKREHERSPCEKSNNFGIILSMLQFGPKKAAMTELKCTERMAIFETSL